MGVSFARELSHRKKIRLTAIWRRMKWVSHWGEATARNLVWQGSTVTAERTNLARDRGHSDEINLVQERSHSEEQASHGSAAAVRSKLVGVLVEKNIAAIQIETELDTGTRLQQN